MVIKLRVNMWKFSRIIVEEYIKKSSFRSPRNAESILYKNLVNVARQFFVQTVVWSKALVWSNHVYGRKKNIPNHVLFLMLNFLTVKIPYDQKFVPKKNVITKFSLRRNVFTTTNTNSKMFSWQFVLTTILHYYEHI